MTPFSLFIFSCGRITCPSLYLCVRLFFSATFSSSSSSLNSFIVFIHLCRLLLVNCSDVCLPFHPFYRFIQPFSSALHFIIINYLKLLYYSKWFYFKWFSLCWLSFYPFFSSLFISFFFSRIQFYFFGNSLFLRVIFSTKLSSIYSFIYSFKHL